MGAGGTDPVELSKVGGRHARNETRDLLQTRAGERAPYSRTGTRRRSAGQPGQRAERLAGGNDAVGIAVVAQLLRGRSELGLDIVAQRVHRSLGRAVTLEPVTRQPPGAERQRDRNVGGLVGAGRQLEGTAADVHADEPARAPPEPAAHGEKSQPGLVVTGQDHEIDAGLFAHPLEHFGAVAGIAHG